jgi:hypothetical protein
MFLHAELNEICHETYGCAKAMAAMIVSIYVWNRANRARLGHTDNPASLER